MKSIEDSPTELRFEDHRRLLVFASAGIGVAAVGAFYFELETLPKIVLIFMASVAFLVGLIRESLRFDLVSRRISFTERFGPWTFAAIEGSFAQITSITVIGGASAQGSSWRIFIEYAGPPERSIELDACSDQEAALMLARNLAHRIGIAEVAVTDFSRMAS